MNITEIIVYSVVAVVTIVAIARFYGTANARFDPDKHVIGKEREL